MPLPPLRFSINSSSSSSEVFLIHDIIAVKDRPCLPAADFHDRFFVHPQAPQMSAPGPPEIVNEQSDVVRFGTVAFTLVFHYGSITDTTRHPAEANIAAHLVPSFAKISDWLRIFTSEHAIFRFLPEAVVAAFGLVRGIASCHDGLFETPG